MFAALIKMINLLPVVFIAFVILARQILIAKIACFTIYTVTMSAQTVKDTMKTLKEKNAAVASPSMDEEKDAEVIEVSHDKPSRKRGRKQQTGKSEKKARGKKRSKLFQEFFPNCVCSVKKLNRAFENGDIFCPCAEVFLDEVRESVNAKKTLTDSIKTLSRRWNCMDGKNMPDIVYYRPDLIPEPDSDEERESQAALEKEDKKKRPKNQFVNDEASEGGDDGDEELVSSKKKKRKQMVESSEESAAEEPDAEEPDAEEPDAEDSVAEEPATSSKDGDQVNQPPSKEQCPVCGDILGVSQKAEILGKTYCMCGHLPYYTLQNESMVLTRVDKDVLPQYKPHYGGEMPSCDVHDYPCRLMIYNPLRVDSKGKPIEVSKDKENLAGRIFIVCATPKEILDGFKEDGELAKATKCDFFKSAEFKPQGELCLHFESLYKKVIVEKQKVTRKARTKLTQKCKTEEKRHLARKKAEQAKWKAMGLKLDE